MQDKDKTPKVVENEARPDHGARRNRPAPSEPVEQPEPLDEDSLDHVLRHTPL